MSMLHFIWAGFYFNYINFLITPFFCVLISLDEIFPFSYSLFLYEKNFYMGLPVVFSVLVFLVAFLCSVMICPRACTSLCSMVFTGKIVE